MVADVRAFPLIKREIVTLSPIEHDLSKPYNASNSTIQPKSNFLVLVINANTTSAKQITVELSKALPDCSILFAPTLKLALLLLKRRPINLVVTTNILPDGSLLELEEFLSGLENAPELVVTGSIESANAHLFEVPNYRFVEYRTLGSFHQDNNAKVDESIIADLGADLRNDLNNPLQEIVAMAFVAKASNGLSSDAEHALDAISKAARNMSSFVNDIENKIRKAVA